MNLRTKLYLFLLGLIPLTATQAEAFSYAQNILYIPARACLFAGLCTPYAIQKIGESIANQCSLTWTCTKTNTKDPLATSKNRAQLWPFVFPITHPIRATQETVSNPVIMTPVVGGALVYSTYKLWKNRKKIIVSPVQKSYQWCSKFFFGYVPEEWQRYLRAKKILAEKQK